MSVKWHQMLDSNTDEQRNYRNLPTFLKFVHVKGDSANEKKKNKTQYGDMTPAIIVRQS